jgi:uncharacterized protein
MDRFTREPDSRGIMRRKQQEISDRTLLESLLGKADVMRFGLCRDSMPYVVPVSFGYHDRRLYVHSALEGMKLDIIRKNNNVCFEAEYKVEMVPAEPACKWTVKYFSVIGFGKAFIVTDVEERLFGLRTIMEHYSGTRDYSFPEDAVKRTAIIRVDIDSMTGKRSGYEIDEIPLNDHELFNERRNR